MLSSGNDEIASCDLKEFSSGAKRSAKKPRYDLISLELLQRVAAVWEKGISKYGEYNWQKAGNDPEFRRDIVNHIVEHAFMLAAGDTSEDHAANLVCNCQMLMHFEASKP